MRQHLEAIALAVCRRGCFVVGAHVALGVVGATVLVAQTSLATSLVGSGQGHGGFQAGQASPQMQDALAPARRRGES